MLKSFSYSLSALYVALMQ